jgi:AcrR family transcriptional regulator
MDRIARRAGITKGGLYYHFPSKEVLRERCGRHLEAMGLRLLEVCEGRDNAREGMRAFIEGHLEEWDYRSFELAALTPGTCYRHMERLVPRLADLIERAVAQGEIRRVDGINHATALVLMLDAAAAYICAETMTADDAAAVIKAGLLGPIERSRYG